MRIESLNQVSQLYKANATGVAKHTDNVSGADKVEISRQAKDLQFAKAAVKASEDIRVDKVNSIKQQIASGTYRVSNEQIADKLVNHYLDALK